MTEFQGRIAIETVYVEGYQQSRERLAERIHEWLGQLESPYLDRIPSPEEISRTRRFGDVLRDIREDKRMTQEQLGQALGMSRMSVSRLELGQKLPKAPRHALNIGRVLGCDPDEMASLLRSFTIDRLFLIVSDFDALGGTDEEEN